MNNTIDFSVFRAFFFQVQPYSIVSVRTFLKRKIQKSMRSLYMLLFLTISQ
jgi:hypothetical protein